MLVAAFVTAGAPAAQARGTGGGRSCLPVSVWTTTGVYTYTVRVERGGVSCGEARSVLRDAADWPPPVAWHCAVGQNPAGWAISCTRGRAVVAAFGPVEERSPWVRAEARLRIGLRQPRETAGLALVAVRVERRCGNVGWVTASYRRGDSTVLIAEGRPTVCGNIGAAPVIAVWHIDGKPVRLVEFCAPTGCSRLEGDYGLDWFTGRLEVTILTSHVSQRQLLAVSKSLSPVPA